MPFDFGWHGKYFKGIKLGSIDHSLFENVFDYDHVYGHESNNLI